MRCHSVPIKGCRTMQHIVRHLSTAWHWRICSHLHIFRTLSTPPSSLICNGRTQLMVHLLLNLTLFAHPLSMTLSLRLCRSVFYKQRDARFFPAYSWAAAMSVTQIPWGPHRVHAIHAHRLLLRRLLQVSRSADDAPT